MAVWAKFRERDVQALGGTEGLESVDSRGEHGGEVLPMPDVELICRAEREVIFRADQALQSRSFILEPPEPHPGLLRRENCIGEGLSQVVEGSESVQSQEE